MNVGHTPLNLSPFLKVSRNNLLNIVRHVYPADVKRPVLPHEASHPAHIVAVVAVFVPPKRIHIRVKQIVYPGQAVQVLALMALGTDAACEKETEVAPRGPVRARVSAISRDAAPRRRGVL